MAEFDYEGTTDLDGFDFAQFEAEFGGTVLDWDDPAFDNELELNLDWLV